MSDSRLPKSPCIAIIVDMVRSRDLSGAARARAQERFKGLVGLLNRKYSNQILARFIITLGDEFQGLLHSSLRIPDILSDLENDFPDRSLRAGIGFGLLYTPVPKYAINIDGPVLHHARAGLEKAKSHTLLGGVFEGFGSQDDILNGVARLLWFHRSNITDQQRTFFNLLLGGKSQIDAAHSLKVSRQLVSKQLASAGWSAYLEAYSAWRAIFATYIEPMMEGRGSDESK